MNKRVVELAKEMENNPIADFVNGLVSFLDEGAGDADGEGIWNAIGDSLGIDPCEDDMRKDASLELADELQNMLIGSTIAVVRGWYKSRTGKDLQIDYFMDDAVCDE